MQIIISKKKNDKFNIKINNLFISTDNVLILLYKKNNEQYFIIGTAYYKNKIINKKNINLIITKNNFSFDYLLDKLSGIFILIKISKKKEIILGSSTNSSMEIFYNKNQTIISSNFKKIENLFFNKKKKRNYEQLSLINIMNTYGSYAPKNKTIYKDISRLGVDEKLIINKKNQISIKKLLVPKQKKNKSILKNNIQNYFKSLRSCIKANSSRKGKNWIFFSSGWDSTSILSILNNLKIRKISPIICKVKYSKKFGFNNLFEIKRAKKFSMFYNLECKVVNIDYTKFHTKKILIKLINNLKSNHLFSIMSLHTMFLANYAKGQTSSKQDTVIYNGDFSDGAHNFGFSQYATFLNHENLGLREYGDKMKNYLFSPAFFQKVKNNTHYTDIVFSMLSKELNIKLDNQGIENYWSRLKKYIMPLFLSKNRFPFESIFTTNLVKKRGKILYEKYIFEKYFLKKIKNLKNNNFYRTLLNVYSNFHWQSSTVRGTFFSPIYFGLRSCSPFADKQVLENLSNFDENEGRSLELKPTKYPLKESLRKFTNYPFDLQKGPHSYLYDVDSSWSASKDFLYYSSFRSDIKKLLLNLNLSDIFMKDYFNLDYLNSLKKNYILNKQENGHRLSELYSLVSFLIIQFNIK